MNGFTAILSKKNSFYLKHKVRLFVLYSLLFIKCIGFRFEPKSFLEFSNSLVLWKIYKNDTNYLMIN